MVVDVRDRDSGPLDGKFWPGVTGVGETVFELVLVTDDDVPWLIATPESYPGCIFRPLMSRRSVQVVPLRLYTNAAQEAT